MSHFVMADIHGCYDPFVSMLQKIRFTEEDTLYIIGDIIDRGPFGLDVLEYIRKKPNIKLLLGNHELMMREALKSGDNELWFYNGGEITFQAYQKLPYENQAAIRAYLEELPLYLDLTIEEKQFRLIHGCPREEENDIENSVWERPNLNKTFFKDRTVIVGHTPTRLYQGRDIILYGRNIIDIDCACVYRGALACLRLEDMREYYIDTKRQ